ncbi:MULTISPECIES: ABC transporter ATP-binding protein [unclassified Saccharopolyspora]|uniref:ABC transporter ATP-binding protein n=1 Tax=unclassified Saccharopolyspora TaxID=2646250 RepID=UPI001CD2C6F1|nr:MULTISPECIES: ABC transporter ATP-binding protein [unclassified Saccharopolyspora]MCA1188854.1 ABC transporter ATP-binding protein/permease [Saccharopolyspora sp. 6T]MCA1229389.1 ABC transporter ATP-binding protein/permease [Saccharopolyspora sp. 6M]MCA1283396.1 ABC transporter ATP-binding protein/permease [Saccharopolyspora sp. 7B]
MVDHERVLAPAVRAQRWPVLLLVLIALAATGCALLLPAALARTVDAAVSGSGAVAPLLALLLLGCGGIAAQVLAVLLSARITAATTARLRADLAERLVLLGHRGPFAAGDAVSRLTGDCAGAGGITATLVEIATAVLLSVGALGALLRLDLRVALVFVVLLPLAVLLARSHLRSTAADLLGYQQASGELGARLLDAVTGLRTIAAAGVAEQEARRVLRPLDRLGAAGAGTWRTQSRLMWRAGLLVPLVQIAVLCAAGLGLFAGRLTVGEVLAALGYATAGMGVVRQSALFTALSRARSCAQRLAEVHRVAPEPAGSRVLPSGPGELRVRGAVVRGVLDGIDLVVPAGTIVAVVGRSGAGKSTLAEVLAGLRPPDRGQVLLDGVPTAELDPAAAHVGVAFARPVLLGTTVATAVSYGAVEADVAAACRAAQVHDLVTRLPDGYLTPLAEVPLSGGEAQRLGLARALARTPRLLVLDDATASLDAITEDRVERAITTALPGRTRVVITHRAGTAGRADLVVWLDEGRIRRAAPHAELWADPDYRALFTEEAPC